MGSKGVSGTDQKVPCEWSWLRMHPATGSRPACVRVLCVCVFLPALSGWALTFLHLPLGRTRCFSGMRLCLQPRQPSRA